MQKFEILTESERQILDGASTVVTSGDTPVVVYLRYSSDGQTDQSIEGQLRDCIHYCRRKNYRIVEAYCDRAATASKRIDKRTDFQRMLSDSYRKQWEAVIVWKLDRFARNRQDSMTSRVILKRNGVRVESATEAIASSPEGILMESMLEGLAEYFSADLSQKVLRGRRETALKGHSLGGNIPLGYKIEHKQFVIDSPAAEIVREIFARYAGGEAPHLIVEDLNARGLRNARGNPWRVQNIATLISNERYVGIYQYKDIVMPDAIPPIIEKEVYDAVQLRKKENARNPGAATAKTEYLLSGKLYCGHCGSRMSGESGTSKRGTTYYYYNCSGRKRGKGCKKKLIRKDWIEDAVVKECLAILDDKLIDEIADTALRVAQLEIDADTTYQALLTKKADVEKSIANLTKVLEMGSTSTSIVKRLDELETELRNVIAEIDNHKTLIHRLDRKLIVYWLSSFKGADYRDPSVRRNLINLLINSVTVWDGPDGGYKLTLAFNLSSKPPRQITPSDLEGDGSNIDSFAVPNRASSNTFVEHGSILLRTKYYPFP